VAHWWAANTKTTIKQVCICAQDEDNWDSLGADFSEVFPIGKNKSGESEKYYESEETTKKQISGFD